MNQSWHNNLKCLHLLHSHLLLLPHLHLPVISTVWVNVWVRITTTCWDLFMYLNWTSCNFLWGWIWNKMKNLVEVHRCSAIISHGSSADVPRSLGLLLDGMILMFWRLNGREIWTCLRHLDSTNSQDVPAYNHLSIHQTSDNDRLQSGLPVCYSKYLNMGKTIISPEYIFQNSVKKYSDRPQTVRLQ